MASNAPMKPKTPISRQQIEYEGQNNYNAYFGAPPQATGSRVETSPIVSEPLPINTAAQQQNTAFDFSKSAATAAAIRNTQQYTSSDLNFLSSNVDPFESSSVGYSTVETAEVTPIVPKSMTRGSSDKLKQASSRSSKQESLKQQRLSAKINLPTPQPFHHSPLIKAVHKFSPPSSQATTNKVIESQEQKIASKSSTTSDEAKEGSKRVYSLGDHGKFEMMINDNLL